MYIQYIDNFLNMTALCNQTKSNRKLFLQLPTKFSLHLLRVFLLYFIILHPLSYQIFILLSILTPDPLNLRSASRG